MTSPGNGCAVARLRGERSWRRAALLVIAVLLVSMACGCRDSARSDAPDGGKDGGGKDGGKGSVPSYPASLSETSVPSDVAAVLIKALDEGDTNTLLGLVAVKAEAAAIDAIFRKYGRKHSAAPGQAAKLAAAGWGATYSFLKKGATEVVGEQVDGAQAVVRAKGQQRQGSPDGPPRGLEIRLIREDGLWKVRAGLKSVEP